MEFYNNLQLDPSILKQKIKQCSTTKEKLYYWLIITLRSILIVAFAIIFISTLANIFGQENTPLAVALFCIMLGIRFVNFEYCIKDSLITLIIALSILLITPSIVPLVSPLLMILIHFVSFFTLLYITSQRPELGNGGLYSFAYIYLTANPVYGKAFSQRIEMAIVGYIICAIILVMKHRHFHSSIRFYHIIKKFILNNTIHLWQLRMAIGVSLIMSIGQIFNIERYMWIGFAFTSLLSQYPYSSNISLRFKQRIIGVLAGCSLFFIIYKIIPSNYYSMIGPFGGICLGFCCDYHYKTAFNCFGALMIATSIYGTAPAVILRIINTIAGVILALLFTKLFHRLIGIKFCNQNIIKNTA